MLRLGDATVYLHHYHQNQISKGDRHSTEDTEHSRVTLGLKIGFFGYSAAKPMYR